MSLRQERLKKEFFRIIKEFFTYEIKNPALQDLGIREIIVSRDLSFLKIYYTTDKNSPALAKALEKVAPAVKATLSNQMKLRKIPNVSFLYDERHEFTAKINTILDKITYSEQTEEELVEKYKNLDLEDLWSMIYLKLMLRMKRF